MWSVLRLTLELRKAKTIFEDGYVYQVDPSTWRLWCSFKWCRVVILRALNDESSRQAMGCNGKSPGLFWGRACFTKFSFRQCCLQKKWHRWLIYDPTFWIRASLSWSTTLQDRVNTCQRYEVLWNTAGSPPWDQNWFQTMWYSSVVVPEFIYVEFWPFAFRLGLGNIIMYLIFYITTIVNGQ